MKIQEVNQTVKDIIATSKFDNAEKTDFRGHQLMQQALLRTVTKALLYAVELERDPLEKDGAVYDAIILLQEADKVDHTECMEYLDTLCNTQTSKKKMILESEREAYDRIMSGHKAPFTFTIADEPKKKVLEKADK